MYQRCQPFFGNPLRLLRVHVHTCNQPSATTYVSINRWGSINSTKLNFAACWVIIRLGHPNKAHSAYMYICGILLLALGLARELIPSRVTLGASLVLFYTRLTAAFTNLKNRTGRATSFYIVALRKEEPFCELYLCLLLLTPFICQTCPQQR